MAQREVERTVQQSVLDRLIDDDPKSSVEAPMRFAQSVNRLKHSLRRDLEWLLNTRRIPDPAGDTFSEVQKSLYHFGLPDISSMSGDSPDVRRRLLRMVEETIAMFEPRLAGVRVSLLESRDKGRRHLRFAIEGMLQMDPSPEPIAFDTMLEISSGKFHISGGA